MMSRSVAGEGVDDFADGVVGQSAVEGFHQVGGGAVFDFEIGGDGGVADGDQRVGFAGARRADQGDVGFGGDPFQVGQVVERRLRDGRCCDVEGFDGFADGNPAALSRLAVLDASRAASSASIRVRSTSSGVQRCVLAVIRISGAMARMVDSFSRRSPAVRSAGSCGGATGIAVLMAVVMG